MICRRPEEGGKGGFRRVSAPLPIPTHPGGHRGGDRGTAPPPSAKTDAANLHQTIDDLVGSATLPLEEGTVGQCIVSDNAGG